MAVPTLPPTLRSMSKAANCQLHQVQYVLEKLQIRPIGFIGITRVFSEEDARRVQAELQKTRRRCAPLAAS